MKVKFVWVIKPLIVKESFRFARFSGFEKGVQSSCSSQKLRYVEKLFISKLDSFAFDD